MSKTETQIPATIISAFDPEEFKKNAHEVVDLLYNFLRESQTNTKMPVHPWEEPTDKLKKWKDKLKTKNDLKTVAADFISESINIHSPRYVGHQTNPSLPSASFAAFIAALLNNSAAIYEMGPAAYAVEKSIIDWMSSKLGYGPHADGIFTSGGSLGNLTALLAARQEKAGYDAWQEGNKKDHDLAVMVSSQSHYSITRALKIMGLGEAATVTLPVDKNFKIDISKLETTYQEALRKGKKIFAIVANACSTATGSYDDLNALANFATKHNLWLHADGAHGASAVLSAKYKNLTSGIEKADSVVWDAHKMMMSPGITTAVIYKNGDKSYGTFSQQASYLFEKYAQEEWYNLCHRTLECTKLALAFRVYLALAVHGEKVFSDMVDHTYDLARDFAKLIKETKDFELAVEPESNIVCFKLKGASNQVHNEIRKMILKSGKFYLVQTDINGQTHFRTTLGSPFTTLEDLKNLLQEILDINTTLI